MRVGPTLEQLVAEYPGKVRVVYKNFVVHPDTALGAHMATCAAGLQGKFKEMMHTFWEKGYGAYAQTRDPSKMGEANILEMAKGIAGLDVAKLAADMKGQECMQRIQSDMDELQKFGVSGTPAFFINGQFVGGAIPKDEFKRIIDEQLKIAEASGIPAEQYYDQAIMAKGEKKFRSVRDPKPGAEPAAGGDKPAESK
jgi:protein-disulfide isomerase